MLADLGRDRIHMRLREIVTRIRENPKARIRQESQQALPDGDRAERVRAAPQEQGPRLHIGIRLERSQTGSAIHRAAFGKAVK